MAKFINLKSVCANFNCFRLSTFKLLMALFIMSSVLISCSEKEFLTTEQNMSSITANDYGSCIQVFSYDNVSIPIEIRKIGYYHNQILGKFTRPPFVNDMSDRAGYAPLKEKLDQIIQTNAVYNGFFENAKTSGADSFYLDTLKVCAVSNPKPDSLILALVNQTCTLLQNHLTNYEINFIKSFFTNGLNGTLNPIIDYVNIVEQNRAKFIDDGNFALALLSIYDNSYCFWSEFNSNRKCILCGTGAVGDVVSGFYAGAKDIIDHGGEPSYWFLKKMGRGAIEGSMIADGGEVASWLGW